MSVNFGNKKIGSVFFGNKAIAAVYQGAKLVWQNIKKILVIDYLKEQCFEYKPKEDIVLQNISFLGQYNGTNSRFRVLNECGLCIAYCAENGIQTDVTIYSLTGTLKTSVGLGTITLYAGQTYYINISGPNYDNMTASRYENLTTNYKSFNNIAQINSVYSANAWQYKYEGKAYTFSDICQKNINTNGCYFIWNGSERYDNGMMPNEDGSQNPYPYFLKRDMSKIKHVFTDADFNNVPVGSYNDDIARYAYIYYIMGNNVGDEFIMNVNYWNRGFEIDPTETSQEKTKYFNNTQNKIYRTTWPFDHNKITSMTPIDNAPQNPQQWDLYYKSNVNSWGGISQRAVVTWDGSKWIIATGYTNEWSEQTDYNATNYMEKITDNNAKDFNNINTTIGGKYYLRINGNEI